VSSEQCLVSSIKVRVFSSMHTPPHRAQAGTGTGILPVSLTLEQRQAQCMLWHTLAFIGIFMFDINV
jgi:hypothetical protein